MIFKNIINFGLFVFVTNFVLSAVSHWLLVGGNEPVALEISKTFFINAFTTIGITAILYLLKKKYEGFLGFIFLGLSFVKMLLFFLLLNPRQGNFVTKPDAILFFCSYFINLIFEIIFVFKLLNFSQLITTSEK